MKNNRKERFVSVRFSADDLQNLKAYQDYAERACHCCLKISDSVRGAIAYASLHVDDAYNNTHVSEEK